MSMTNGAWSAVVTRALVTMLWPEQQSSDQVITGRIVNGLTEVDTCWSGTPGWVTWSQSNNVHCTCEHVTCMGGWQWSWLVHECQDKTWSKYFWLNWRSFEFLTWFYSIDDSCSTLYISMLLSTHSDSNQQYYEHNSLSWSTQTN